MQYPVSIPISASVFALLFGVPAFGVAEDALVAVPNGPNFQKFPAVSQPVDASTKIRVALGLSGFQKAASAAFVESQSDPNSPNYHHWISSSVFAQKFGAPQADIDLVSGYLTKAGFTNLRVGAGGSYVSASGTIGVATSAFGTTFANFVRPAGMVERGEPQTFFGPRGTVMLPEAIAGKVNGAFGLDSFILQHKGLRRAGKGAAIKKQTFNGYTPAQITTAYDATGLHKSSTGAGMTIAVYSPTERYPGDPATFVSNLGLPADFTIYDLFVDGGPTNNNGADEASLDLEVIIGQAPSSTIYMICPDGTTGGELDSYSALVDIGTIPVLSSSWGIEESVLIAAGSNGTAFANAFDSVCSTVSAAGITMFNDSGDWAAYDSGKSGKVTVQMETACQYITGVGGTSLYFNSNGTYKNETLWEFTGSPTAPEGGGGGLSQIYKIPSWQTGYGVLNSANTGKWRECPDVTADSDPNTGYYTVVNGAVELIGGTSAATPLWASNMLLIEQYFGLEAKQVVFLGNINKNLYLLGNAFENITQDPANFNSMFHDITVGSNGVYKTLVGFDLCAGWGSVDFTKASHDLGYEYNIPTLDPDFEPYKPPSPGWTSPVMIHSSATSITEPTSFVHGTTYYISPCAVNNGPVDGPACNFLITANTATMVSAAMPAISPSAFYNAYLSTFKYAFPSAGTYTITFTVNSQGKVRELSTTNNVYTRTVTVK